MAWRKSVIEPDKVSAVRVSYTELKIFSLACLLLLVTSTSAMAQSNSHRCRVSVSDFNTDEANDLGSFTTVIVSDRPTAKSFRLPGTKLVLTAGVLYMRESPYLEGTPPSEILLILILGKRPYPVTGEGLSNAEVLNDATAIVPLKSFEKAEVQTTFHGRPEPVIVKMQCKNDGQR